jgi:hypothetical protein
MPEDPTDVLNQPARRSEGRYFGKYRGLVKDNKDPLKIGRLQVTVPAVYGMATNWALPCAPYAGEQVGFYAMPPIGALVWVEFEGGDPSHPIWSGGFWQAPEVPAEVNDNADDPSQVKVFKTRVATLWIDDTDQLGKITLRFKDDTVSEGATVTLVIDSTGVSLTVAGSSATSTIVQTAEDITTDSTTLGTTTSQDTTVTAQGKITASADQDVTITAGGKLAASATSDASLSGMNTSVEASTALSLSGATATLQGDTSVTISASGTFTASANGPATITSTASTTVSGGPSLTLGGASITFVPV